MARKIMKRPATSNLLSSLSSPAHAQGKQLGQRAQGAADLRTAVFSLIEPILFSIFQPVCLLTPCFLLGLACLTMLFKRDLTF